MSEKSEKTKIIKEKAAPLTAEEKAAKKLQKKFDKVDKKLTWQSALKVIIPLVIIIIVAFVILKAAFGNNKNIKFDTSAYTKTDAAPVDTSKGINGQLMSDAGMTIFADISAPPCAPAARPAQTRGATRRAQIALPGSREFSPACRGVCVRRGRLSSATLHRLYYSTST